MEFSGPATRFSEGAIAEAAKAIGCEVAAVKAVIAVESQGGFFADTRPKILFERHVFSKQTGGRFDASHPDLSASKAGGYQGGAAEHDRLARAIKLDRAAALKSASWGAFQIMGYHGPSLGYADAEAFCQAMCRSEDDHLDAFVRFVTVNKLNGALCRRDWTEFARRYNGPAFAKNQYDAKLAAAYAKHGGSGGSAEAGARTLTSGDEGADVTWLQTKLGIRADGSFGPATKAAVMAFQRANRLAADGVVGAATRRALGS